MSQKSYLLIGVDVWTQSSDCGVKFDQATRKRRRVEELREDGADITTPEQAHCATCTSCSPVKKRKLDVTSDPEYNKVLRNVRWTMDDKDQTPPEAQSQSSATPETHQ